MDRIPGSAGLSGRISGYPAGKSRISGNIREGMPDHPAGHPVKKADPAQPYSLDLLLFSTKLYIYAMVVPKKLKVRTFLFHLHMIFCTKKAFDITSELFTYNIVEYDST